MVLLVMGIEGTPHGNGDKGVTCGNNIESVTLEAHCECYAWKQQRGCYAKESDFEVLIMGKRIGMN